MCRRSILIFNPSMILLFISTVTNNNIMPCWRIKYNINSRQKKNCNILSPQRRRFVMHNYEIPTSCQVDIMSRSRSTTQQRLYIVDRWPMRRSCCCRLGYYPVSLSRWVVSSQCLLQSSGSACELTLCRPGTKQIDDDT